MDSLESHFNINNIENAEKQFRTTLINSLSGFKTAGLIGTKNKSGQTNLAIFNSFIHIGASPALVGFISRPSSVSRNTLENILNTGFFTINHINKDIFKAGHQTSARYPSLQSEFAATGLNEEYKNDFYAPFVLESHVKIALEFKEKIDITINDTILVIGQIKDIYFPKEILQADGFLNLEMADSVISCGLDSYHTVQQLTRLSYAKVDKVLEEFK